MNDEIPHAWAAEAATLPVAFAQVREDSRLDRELCTGLAPGATVMMIASGGDTAVCLARKSLGRLVVVDANAAQLALTHCKLYLAGHTRREEALAWLGHLPMDPADRRDAVGALLQKLGLPSDTLGPMYLVAARGADFCGRYEACFAQLRAALAGQEEALREFLNGRLAGAAAIACDTALGAALNEAFAKTMSPPNLVALFGPEATQNPRMPFACHFAQRTRIAAARMAPRQNPFLWQILAGEFPPGVTWDWLTAEEWEKPLRVTPEYCQSPMLEVMRAQREGSVDVLHLSNILDWLSPEEATELLETAHRVLKPGGAVFIRQLNSSLEIPALTTGLAWDFATAGAMEERDRSYFYPHLHLGRKVAGA